MSRTTLCLAFLVATFAGPASAAELRLEIADGYVTLVATDTPLPQILAEWAKVGGTRIVNAERVAGPPVTIQLQQVPEQQALAVLLRSVAGYVAAPRRAGAPGASVYESVMILATSTPPATQPSPAAAARGAVIRGIPAQVEMPGQQQLMPEGSDQIASDGFITVGSAPAPRQTPAAGAGATAGPMGPAFPQVPVAGARTSNPQPGSTPTGFPTQPTATPPGVTQPVAPPTGVQSRPTTIQPGILLPNDGTRIQTNPNVEP